MQRQLPGRFVVEAGYNAQLGRHLTTNLLSLNQVDPAIFYGFVQQYGPAGAINLMNSRMDSTLARQANIPYPYPSFPGIAVGAAGAAARSRSTSTSTPALTAATAADDRATTRSSSKGEKRYGSGLTFLTSYVFSKTFSLRSDRANAGDGRAMNHFNRDAGKGPVGVRPDPRDQVELQLRAAVRARQAISEGRVAVEDRGRLAHLGRAVVCVGVPA